MLQSMLWLLLTVEHRDSRGDNTDIGRDAFPASALSTASGLPSADLGNPADALNQVMPPAPESAPFANGSANVGLNEAAVSPNLEDAGGGFDMFDNHVSAAAIGGGFDAFSASAEPMAASSLSGIPDGEGAGEGGFDMFDTDAFSAPAPPDDAATLDAAFGSPLFAISSCSASPPEAVAAEPIMDAFAALPSVAPPACSGADDGGFSEFDEPAAGFDAFETSDISAPSGSSGFDAFEPATASTAESEGYDAFQPAAVHDGGGGFDAFSAAPSVGATPAFSELDPFRGM